jgi:hypothetical protein
MEKQAIKELMYGGINEMMQNRKFYYHSAIGRSYSNWTPEGEIAMKKFLDEMTKFIYDAEQAALDDRSKDMLLKALKS